MKAWPLALLAAAATAANAARTEVNTPLDSPSPVSTITQEELAKLPVGQRVEDLIKSCPAQTIPTVGRPMRGLTVIDGAPARPSIECVKPDDLRMIEILKEHNNARAQVGSSPMVWDPYLARGAAAYAQQLTTTGRAHSSREGRADIRENLLQSLRGQRSPRQMVRVWLSEQRYFTPGTFPNVSTTGNWYNVGHYTQIVWPTTIRLGCAIHSDLRYDWTVCRYSPPGNRDGTPIFAGRQVGNTPMPQPRGEVAGGPGGIAPADSRTTTVRPIDLGRLPMGGGMTQIDPPPPPPPTGRDAAPGGDEAQHPLVAYFNKAFDEHAEGVHCDDRSAEADALYKMRYALEELRKRLKDAKQAGQFSAVKEAEVQKQIDAIEAKLKIAEERREQKAGDRKPGGSPPGTCPKPPPPPQSIIQ